MSGIGCAARFPYYMNTYGMHTIHGRAPAIATGLAMARPDLDVWVVTGDGDALSIGGNHLIHALRRNVNLTILLFNNQIYGLTKGQYSPTSEVGKVTKSTPFGSPRPPVQPASAWPSAPRPRFVARTHDMDRKHMMEIVPAGPRPQGRGVRRDLPELQRLQRRRLRGRSPAKEHRDDMLIPLVHGEPIRFGADGEQGVVIGSRRPAAHRRRGRRRRGRPPRARRGPRRPEPGLHAVPPVDRRPLSRRRSACSGPSSGPSTATERQPPARRRGRAQGPGRPRRAAALRRHLDGRAAAARAAHGRATARRPGLGLGVKNVVFGGMRSPPWAVRRDLATVAGRSSTPHSASPPATAASTCSTPCW